jgi:hypothetical protein
MLSMVTDKSGSEKSSSSFPIGANPFFDSTFSSFFGGKERFFTAYTRRDKNVMINDAKYA